jgi:radical SAM superfamily enzyme YgiQ (UPF0313 family)
MSLDQHWKGTNARVLLTSVFGPYAQDDEYGSRKINPMELYQNQVTRAQGPFSLRMFHRSWGLMMIQRNISAPSTLLDFPTLEQFTEELKTNDYDIVGISSIIPNVGKVRKMCALIRELQPRCTIVVGGHISNLPDVLSRIDADHIVRGDGISWFRKFLGQDESELIEHPELLSGFGGRAMGISLSEKPEETAAVLIPSVGCPVGCNFCCTSAMFGGKGKFINFFETGADLYRVMSRLEQKLKVHSFFVMDENFLLHRSRALELLELMRRNGKPWSLYVFSSGRVLRSYTMEELIGLGISWVWMGLEGENSAYSKLRNIDTHELVRDLQSNGIRVLGSTIIGLETHTPENIEDAIDYAIAHDTDFHQFMLYTPMPGTPLHEEHAKMGTLLPDVDEADIHGQFAFNFRHPHITREQSGKFLDRAFERDYAVNGPSLMRIARTVLQGYRRHKNNPDPRVRARFEREAKILPLGYAAVLSGMERYFRKTNAQVTEKIRRLRADLAAEFGWRAGLAGMLGGPILLQSIRREERRLARGWIYQTPSFVERRNWEPEQASVGMAALAPMPQPES